MIYYFLPLPSEDEMRGRPGRPGRLILMKCLLCAGLMLVCRNVVEHNNHHHHSQSSLAHQSSASPPLRHSVNNDQRSKVKPVETLVLDHSSLRYPQSLSPSVLLRQLIIKLI